MKLNDTLLSPFVNKMSNISNSFAGSVAGFWLYAPHIAVATLAAFVSLLSPQNNCEILKNGSHLDMCQMYLSIVSYGS